MQGRFALACFAALISLTAAPAACAQGRVLLKDTAAVGDVFQEDDLFSSTTTITVSVPGQNARELHFASRQHELFTTRVLGHDDSGITAIRRTYAVSRSVDTTPDATKQKKSSLEGRTVTARRVGKTITIKVDKGTLDASDEKNIRRELRDSKARLFPNRQVAIGEEWSIDPKLLTQDLDGVDSADARGKLVEIVSHKGHRCAHIAVVFEVTGRPGKLPQPVHFTLSGPGYYALDLGRTLDLDLSGRVTGDGEMDANGVKVPYQVDGNITARTAQKWLAVGR